MLIWSFAQNIDIDEVVSIQDSLQAKKRHGDTNQFLIMAEHKKVFSYNKNRPIDSEQLRVVYKEFEKFKIPIKEVNRGGSISYHGPGQLTCYFIISLPEIKLPDYQSFDDLIEETNKQVLFQFGIRGYAFQEIKKLGTSDPAIYNQIEESEIVAKKNEAAAQGIWVITREAKIKKIVCRGIHLTEFSQPIVTFGCALNVSTDLYYFNNIIKPCGLDIQITSIKQETNDSLDIRNVGKSFVINFVNLLSRTSGKILEKKYMSMAELTAYKNSDSKI